MGLPELWSIFLGTNPFRYAAPHSLLAAAPFESRAEEPRDEAVAGADGVRDGGGLHARHRHRAAAAHAAAAAVVKKVKVTDLTNI